MTVLLGRGSYSFTDASRFTRLKTSRVREWFSARSTTKVGSVFRSDFDGHTSQRLISFLDLVDVFVAGQLRDSGISLQTLRKVYRTLQVDLGVEHPFGRRELLTDGRRVFTHGLDKSGKQEVVDVLSRQKAFPKIILPFLRKLHFDNSSHLAVLWNIDRGVVLNPEICFGQPIVEGKGIPTEIIAKAVIANKNDAHAVADWYGLTVSQVRNAHRFESLAAA